MNSPVFSNLVSQIIGLFLERIASQELDNLRNLGQSRFNPIFLPKIYRGIVDMKLEGKLALGELQIQPPGLNPVAPGPQKIRVFLPVNRFLSL